MNNNKPKCCKILNESIANSFINSNSYDLSQLCNSSQFIRQIENVLSACASNTDQQSGQELHISPDQVNSDNFGSSQVNSGNFSLSTTSVPLTTSGTSCSNHPKIANMLDNTTDKFLTQDNLFLDIDMSVNSSNYKIQISAAFDELQTSILEPSMPSNITINAINWDESMAKSQTSNDEHFVNIGPFYGLPAKVLQLICQFKGIEKLYDWQDECLRLEAITCRRNLVYSLPTSGGKTLVSEILIMREVLCRRHNALLVLPYVSIVQEKVWALAPFAVDLNFLIEEYAAGRGRYPPRYRRNKRSVYVATIEKALGLVNSLMETNRLGELGLVVVDELHLVGEEGRGATLETLLTKLRFAQCGIQVVGMSATIGNLTEICRFLDAELYSGEFRPIRLEEYVCCENELALSKPDGILQPVRRISGTNKIDPDGLGALVAEVVPQGSCLMFCPTKKNCENVALLLSRVFDKCIIEHNKQQKQVLMRSLQAENSVCDILSKTLPYGVAYHHSGLTTDERLLIEEAFRNGTICVICCTSTLAAGVNLPAERVILRSPYVGLEFISLARYKQMSGRAGRTGLANIGQSILVCEKKDLERVVQLLNSPMESAMSRLTDDNHKCLKSLLLSCIALGTASTRRELQRVVHSTLMATQADHLQLDVNSVTDLAIANLFKQGALQTEAIASEAMQVNVSVAMPSSLGDTAGVVNSSNRRRVILGKDERLVISRLGRAAIKAGLDLDKAHLLYSDLAFAQSCLVLLDCLHLLYLVTPYELAAQVRPQPLIYYGLYMELGANQLRMAATLGITDSCALSILSGKGGKGMVSERVLNRFYLTLMLYELWNGGTVTHTATKFNVSRGLAQQLMTSAATFAASVVHFCEELDELWPFAEMLRGMCDRLQHCSAKELLPLMDLPAVKLGRAKQLFAAGFKTLQSIARAKPEQLVREIEHLSRKVAAQLVAAAKMLLLEKVENLREEAEDVLEGMSHV